MIGVRSSLKSNNKDKSYMQKIECLSKMLPHKIRWRLEIKMDNKVKSTIPDLLLFKTKRSNRLDFCVPEDDGVKNKTRRCS